MQTQITHCCLLSILVALFINFSDPSSVHFSIQQLFFCYLLETVFHSNISELHLEKSKRIGTESDF